MRKLLLGIVVLVFVVFASSVMAAGPRVPKNLCLDFDSYADYHLLLIKPVSNIPTSDGNLKMYSVSGYAEIANAFPFQGNAYVLPSGTILHATYGGMFSSASQLVGSFGLYFDLAAKTGTIYYHYESADGTSAIHSSSTVTAVDCKTMVMPAGAVPSGIDRAARESFTNAAH